MSFSDVTRSDESTADPIGQHIGDPGEWLDLKLKYRHRYDFDRHFGPCTVVTFTDQDNNELVWFTTPDVPALAVLELMQEYRVCCRVVKHQMFTRETLAVRQTVISEAMIDIPHEERHQRASNGVLDRENAAKLRDFLSEILGD